MRKNKFLVLTGWSKPTYVAAAAAVLEALGGKADVAGRYHILCQLGHDGKKRNLNGIMPL